MAAPVEQSKRWFPVMGSETSNTPCGVVPWEMGQEAAQKYIEAFPEENRRIKDIAWLGGLYHDQMLYLIGPDWKKSFYPAETLWALAKRVY